MDFGRATASHASGVTLSEAGDAKEPAPPARAAGKTSSCCGFLTGLRTEVAYKIL